MEYLYRVKKSGTEGFIALRVADMPEASPDDLVHLAEECRLYFQYQHHKIVQFNEPMIDWESGHIEVEMEYMPGGTLEQYLVGNHGSQIPEVDIWQILGDVTEGLAHLHSRINGRAPTAHCDLRPATILRKQNIFKLSFLVFRGSSCGAQTGRASPMRGSMLRQRRCGGKPAGLLQTSGL